jgi:septum formation protein
MKAAAPIILASQSPRRQQLLREAGFTFEVFVRPVPEDAPDDLHPRAVAVLIAENKAKAYDDLARQNIVITADTVVALDDQMLAKPADAEEAAAFLRKLSARTHSVFTGVTLFYKGRLRSFAEETLVTFRKLREPEIAHYINEYKPFDKAGAYGIQEWIGLVGISRIEGDYYNVMGLPMARLYEELLQLE